MATYTSNYGWTKPSGSDNVDISVLNDNLDDQDSTIHDAFLNMAPPFSESSTYAVDDIVLYGTGLYKCHTAVVTPGSWTGSTNWQVYKLSEGGSGSGGTSNYNQLTNKPQINNVELSGNKTASQLGLMASDGVVANPTGQTTGTLTALEVGGTKYAVPSGGTSDYTDLTNKPSINNVTLTGNKTTSDLGINADNVMMSDGVTSVEDKIGNVRITKIWNNPNPTENFPEQTINIDVVGFDLIAIIAKNSTTSDAMVTNITLNGHSGLIISAVDENYARTFNTVTKKFTACFKRNTIDNSVLIPYQIYGIKLT